MSKMEELVRGVARYFDTHIEGLALCDSQQRIQRVLRESSLLRLLKAGQAMRLATQGTFKCERETANEWDIALTKMKERTK